MTKLFKKVKQTLLYKTPMGDDTLFGDRTDAKHDGRNAAAAAGAYTNHFTMNNNNEYPWFSSSQRQHVSSSAWNYENDFSSDYYYDGFPVEDPLNDYHPRVYERHARFADYLSSPSTGFSDERRASTTRDLRTASITSSLPRISRRESVSNSARQERRPSDFPTTPITSTCTHLVTCTCPECIVRHLTTRLPSRGERRASANSGCTPASFTSSQPRKSRRGSISTSPLLTCSICAEERQTSEFPIKSITSTCTHPVTDTCKECIRRHLATQLSSRGTAALHCICNQPLSLTDVQQNADPKDFERYSERATMEMLESDSQFIWCPAQGCQAGQLQQRGSDEPKVTCARCRQPFCFIHRVRWHAGMTCREFDQNPELADEARAREKASSQRYRRQKKQQELSNQQRRAREVAAREKREREAQERENESYVRRNATPCPSCRYMTQKDGGCKHMTCKFFPKKIQIDTSLYPIPTN